MDRAIALCQHALLFDRTCLDALLILGSFAARTGRVVEAEGLLRQALTVDPNNHDALRWLTTLLISKKGGTDAVEFGIRLVALSPNDVQAQVVLGLAYIGNGNDEQAIASFKRALELDPELVGAYHNMGIAYQRQENYEEAIAAFRRATELSPNLTEAIYHLAKCHLAVDQADEALLCAYKVIELAPNSRAGRQLVSDCSFAAVHGDHGIEHIRRAIEKDAKAAFPHAVLGSLLQEEGSFSEAESEIQTSINLQPNQGFAYYLLAHNRKIVEADRPTIEKIDEISRQSLSELEERQYIHFALGKAYDDLGEFEKAISHLDLAHEQEPGKESDPKLEQHKLHAIRADGFIQAFSKQVLQQFPETALDSIEPIFIFGMPRSGTTLLEQIVSRHSTVGAAGELFFWRDHARRIINLRQSALNPSELKLAGRKYLELIRSKAPGKLHVTDKFPSNYLYLGLLQMVFPNAKFIHARRHPLDICLSIYMRPFSTNQGLGRTRREIVDSYKAYRRSMDHWKDVMGADRFIEVEYEQLVQDPEHMTRNIIAKCGLEWEDACLTPQEGNRRVSIRLLWSDGGVTNLGWIHSMNY